MDLFLHIGGHKCGSTTLQRRFFVAHPDVTCLHCGPVRDLFPPDLMLTIQQCETLEYNRKELWLVERCRELLPDHGVCVISKERLSMGSGPGYSPGKVSRAEIASRLASLFPAASVIFVIRNQFEVLKSHHNQALKSGARIQHDFSAWIETEIAHLSTTGNLNYYDYAPLVKHYDRLIGPKRVNVLLLEDLRDDPRAFIDHLSKIMKLSPEKSWDCFDDTRENSSRSKQAVGLLRLEQRIVKSKPYFRFSHMIPSSTKKVCRKTLNAVTGSLASLCDSFGRVSAAEFTEAQQRRLREFYAPGNQWLSKRLDIDLGQHGYPVD